MSDVGKAVFLSYASQDAEAAKRICDALRAAGVEVWFDQSELVGGDQWDAKIKKQIQSCALFIPIISTNTQARTEGYFRLEWRLADQRTHLMAKGRPFLLPVVIDDTRDAEAHVPDAFLEVQWSRFPGGQCDSRFAGRVQQMLSGEMAASAHAKPPAASGATGRAQGGRRWPWLVVPVVLAAALAVWPLIKRPPALAAAAEIASPTDALVARAKALIDDDPLRVRENYRTAVELCARATTLSPDDAEAWATGARATTFLLFHYNEKSDKQVAAARSQAERAMRLAPDAIESGLAMAFFDAVAGAGPDAAERRLRALLERAPKERRILEVLALIAGDVRENVDECRGWAERADALPGGSPLALEQLAWAYWGANRFPELAQVLARIFARRPTSVAYHLQLMLLRSSDDLDGVLVWLDKTPAAVLAEDRVVSLAVEVYQMKGQPEKALALLGRIPREFLEEGRYLAPKSYLVGQLLQSSGKPRAAEVEFRAALKAIDERIAANPHEGELFSWRGRVLVQLGDKVEAAKQFATGRELGADSTVNVDAADEVMLGNYDAAIAAVDRKLQRERSRWPSFFIDLKYGPAYAALRGDPRFQALLARGQAWLDEMRSRPAKPPAAAAVAKVDEKSVAVLAFANLSDDKANEYFSDGISEELLNVLAKIPGLKVAARTSAFYFKGKEVPVPEIAQQLGVAYVVEGSVRKQGDKVRITAQLIKAADGFHVWSDTFTRDLKDIFAVQDEIAGLIANNLQLKMGMGETGARQAVSPEAYQEYLLGRAAAAKASAADMRAAVTHFDRAVALEPKYAAAWVQLASAHTRLGRWGGAPTRQAWLSARAAIDRARALEPDSPEVLLALGWILRTGEWDWRGAERAFRRALALQPNQPEIQAGAAVLLFNIGQTDEAFRLARQAIQLDPLNAGTQIDLSLMFCLSKNWAEAEKAARRALQLAPGGTAYHCILAWSLIAQQRLDEAEAELNLDHSEDGIDRFNTLGLLAVARGQDKVAREWLARLEAIARTNGDLADLQQNIAWLNTILGEKDRAFAALEKAYISRDPSMSWLLNSWWLEPLHSDPRWPALVHKVGLAEEQLK